MANNVKKKMEKFAETGRQREVWQQGKSYNLGKFIIALVGLVVIAYFFLK